ncbi:amidohydrolase family protein [Shumkonia mesophila]|uniref:amidohydrolase family protein n=1 Tax=Shumkonia mesophila TaxID=2838854 RepID=UPI002934422A|nr:amidohydrolase family protein [Shumkonia mesophila]
MESFRSPRVMPPVGAIDTHIHIVGDYDAYPLAPTAAIKPKVATVSDYRTVIGNNLGVRRAVVVQASIYGFDNTCVLDAVAELGDNGWGVAVVPTDISERDLKTLHERRIRGVRFHMLPGGMYSWDDVSTLCAKIAPLGWFAQIQFDGRTFADHAALLGRLKLPVVIDHQGKFLEPVLADHKAVLEMARFLERENGWLKIAGAYETSLAGAPFYEDVRRSAQVLLEAAPDRTIWASNWPHFAKDKAPSDNVILLDLLLDWVKEDVTAYERILADNPRRLLQRR